MQRSASRQGFHSRLRDLLWGPQLLAFLPALTLGAYWLVGEGGLIAVALGLPVLWSLFGSFQSSGEGGALKTPRGAPHDRDVLITRLTALFETAGRGDKIVLFRITVDDRDELRARFSKDALDTIKDRLHNRYTAILRSGDIVAHTGDLSWTVALAPGGSFDLEVAIQQASRLQAALDDPFFHGEERVYLTACIGFALSNAPCEDLSALLDQAQVACIDAVQNGPDAIRAYSPAMSVVAAPPRNASAPRVDGEIERCLTAWFQPQICTDTGRVSGFEALARWQDDSGKMLAPSVFLPVLETSGRLERLSELMLTQALTAMQGWQAAGFDIETVGVNFSEHDLSNPRFFEKVAWDLDRFGIAPHRLCIEVLESVIAGGSDEMIVRNVSRVAELGCQIDLDDFGTGHASISTLRRLPIGRLKIDRSFVARADLDSEQQKMVSTILMMADRLGLTCLAEGVETLGEHAILAQLGCKFVQGFGIAKPMPFDQTLEWITDYQAKLSGTPQIGRKSAS